MSENSKTEWKDHTFKPREGCEKVGRCCNHCHAEEQCALPAALRSNCGPGAPRRRTSAADFRKPLRFTAAHAEFLEEHGRRRARSAHRTPMYSTTRRILIAPETRRYQPRLQRSAPRLEISARYNCTTAPERVAWVQVSCVLRPS
jgi:hypothetical protein